MFSVVDNCQPLSLNVLGTHEPAKRVAEGQGALTPFSFAARINNRPHWPLHIQPLFLTLFRPILHRSTP